MPSISNIEFRFDHGPIAAGVPVVVSEHATALPKLREPRTDDMRAMVDDLLVRQPPARVPTMLAARGQIVVHPVIWDRLRRETSQMVALRDGGPHHQRMIGDFRLG